MTFRPVSNFERKLLPIQVIIGCFRHKGTTVGGIITMRVWGTLTGTVFALALAVGTAQAQTRPGIRPFVKTPEGCSYSEPVETENLYTFTRTQIQALAFAQAGEGGGLRALAGGEALFEQMAKTMTDLRQAQIDDTCAGFILSPYADSKNKSIATTAKYLAFAYGELGKMTNEMMGIAMRASMQRKSGGASTRSQLSDLRGRRQEILKNMADALNLSLSLLVDQSHTDAEGKPDRLILTHTQKISLLDYLHSRFPTLSYEKATGYSDFITQAALIESFLNLGTDSVTQK